MNGSPVSPPRADGPRSGILALRNAIAAYFVEWGVPAVVAPVGLKYRSFTLGQGQGGANRVVVIPGEFDGDPKIKARKYGSLSRSSRNAASGFNPRELLSWDRPITLSVWAAPEAGQAQDEGLSIARAEDLLEQVVRAAGTLRAADGSMATASLHWGDVQINAPPVEGGFGAELLIHLTQVGPIFDVTYDVVQAKLVQSTEIT